MNSHWALMFEHAKMVISLLLWVQKGPRNLKISECKKIPNHEKNNLISFLTQGNEILWAIGLGISDKIKVTNNPTHRLKYYKKREI